MSSVINSHVVGLLLLLSAACSHSASQETGNEKPWAAAPETVKNFSKRKGFNYDETRVPKFKLPDPLMTNDGSQVTTATQWTSKRRPELLELFRRDVYGRRPTVDYKVTFTMNNENVAAFDGKARGRNMTATIAIDDRKFEFPFTLFIPKTFGEPVPAVILVNNRYQVPVEKAAKEIDPFWPVERLIDRGYATACFHTSDVDPDRKDGYAEGIRSFFAAGKPPEPDSWRSLSAWGWGASRILDHLESLAAIDARRVALVGHSRGGKATLWAASEDTRFAIAYSNNSGCGGAALSRREYGETVKRITSSFPHWFNKNFVAYADRINDLPIDQHELVALIAPRSVYVASADEDLWADPRGEHLSIINASPVFRLLGKDSISNPEMPPLGMQRVVGSTGYHIRSGKHDLGEVDWNFFLDFADARFKNN